MERREGEQEGDLLGDRRGPRGLFTTVVMVSSLVGERAQEELGTEAHSLAQLHAISTCQRPSQPTGYGVRGETAPTPTHALQPSCRAHQTAKETKPAFHVAEPEPWSVPQDVGQLGGLGHRAQVTPLDTRPHCALGRSPHPPQQAARPAARGVPTQ